MIVSAQSAARKRTTGLALLASVVALGCGDGANTTPWVWELPEDVPEPRVPEDNPMSVEKVELGRFLFYDKRLSGNETQSCASCHAQERAFTDGLARAVGSTDEEHPRNAMPIFNAAYQPSLTWANPVVVRLERQAEVPMFGEVPVELGLTDGAQLVERLRVDETYQELFAAAFPESSDPINQDNITKAIAAFQRSVVSFGSRVDQYLASGDLTLLTPSELRGSTLFFGGTTEAGIEDDAQCFHCHGGFLYSQSVDHLGLEFDGATFVNNGLYNLDEFGAYPGESPGLIEFTGDRGDHGAFKPPTLRNIALTAPYMHDGSIATLDEVLSHYERGGSLTTEGPNAGDGALNPNKDAFVDGMVLSVQERCDLLAFMRALTDESLCTNPAYSDPFADAPPTGCIELEKSPFELACPE